MEQELQNIESLYDFIYVDNRRIGLYLAQLDPNGTLTGIKSSASLSSQISLTGKINVAVSSGAVGDTSSRAEALERHFDPTWTLPITVMDRLDELGFIHRSAASTPVGQLFLAKGRMQLLDIRMMRQLWSTLFGMLPGNGRSAGNRRERRRDAASQARVGLPFDPKVTAEMLSHLPHALQMHFLSEDGLLWATLNPDNMIVAPDDFALKHGTYVPGRWHVLAIKDSDYAVYSSAPWLTLPISDLAKGMIQAVDTLRLHLGRPESSYAITPLAIFRSVKTVGADEANELKGVSEGEPDGGDMLDEKSI